MPTDDTNQSSAAPTPRPRGLLGRLWQRFWHGEEMHSLAQPLAAEPTEYLRRARLASEVARRSKESSEAFPGSIEPVLCDLYRQAIHWSLLGLQGRKPGASEAPRASEAFQAGGFVGLDRATLLRAAGDEQTLAWAASAVDGFTFKEFATLSPEDRSRLLSALEAITRVLIAELDVSRRLVDALWLQRVLRVGLLCGLLLAVLGVAMKIQDGREAQRDLAVGKVWRTSSWYGGCHSPEQECADGSDYFFHTQEESSPWIEFDLGSPQRFTAVRADNRKDCCTERAAPLLVEVSDDDRTWRTVARRDAVFKSWLAEFAPIKARWVRLRVTGRGPLHLTRVRVLR